jgi:Trk K+ transport system NAD-binding subunit
MIHRNGKYLNASGSTIIAVGDHLLVMADNKSTLERVYHSFGVAQPAH